MKHLSVRMETSNSYLPKKYCNSVSISKQVIYFLTSQLTRIMNEVRNNRIRQYPIAYLYFSDICKYL